MTTQTLCCKPLTDCTADDITPIDETLRADAIDYLAGHDRDMRFTGSYSTEHLLRLCAEVDDSVGCGPSEDGIITICEGGFAGHFAPPATIERMRAGEQDQVDRLWLQGDSELYAVDGARGWSVVDPDGGQWWPSDEAAAEIAAAGNPSARARRICDTEPMRGSWSA